MFWEYQKLICAREAYEENTRGFCVPEHVLIKYSRLLRNIDFARVHVESNLSVSNHREKSHISTIFCKREQDRE